MATSPTFTNTELEGMRILVVKARNSIALQKKTGLGLVEISEIVEKIDTLLRQIPSSKLDDSEKDMYDISIEDDVYIINDTENDVEYKIDMDLVYDGKIAKYTIEDRDSRIDDLENWIGASSSDSDKYLMREDLEYLRESRAEYVFGNYGSNGFIAKDVDMPEFNKVCQELIESFTSYQNGESKWELMILHLVK